VSALESKRSEINEHLSGLPLAAEGITGYASPIDFGQEIFSGRYVNSNYRLEKYLIPGSGDYLIPMALFVPTGYNRNAAILMLHEKGKYHAANVDSLAKRLIANGYTVLLGDLPGIGELGPGYLKGDAYIKDVSYNQWFAGILTGKSIVGLRAEDIIRMANFIKNNLSDCNSISAISVGVTGSELLHAAVFDGSIEKICLVKPFLGFADIALSHEYSPAYIPSTVAGAINHYDLADLMAALYPRELLIINPLSGNGTLADEKKAGEGFAFPENVFSQKDRSEEFNFVCRKEHPHVIEEILNWLNK
jgi:hypothetical protein